MDSYRLAAKSFIVRNDRLLIIKRASDDVHKPGVWEIPGGRLDPGEDIFEGLKRETREETGLEIYVSHPLRVHSFVRDDKQRINLLSFLCGVDTAHCDGRVRLSAEHTASEWALLENARAQIHSAFYGEIDHYCKYFRT